MEDSQAPKVHKVHWFFLLLEGIILLIGLPAGALFLLYRDVRPVTVWELTGSCPPASALLRSGGEAGYAFDTGRIDWTHPGDAVVLVDAGLVPRIAVVRIQDTTAPAATGVSRVLGVDEEPGPDYFITDLKDRQLVGVSYEQAPAFHRAGEYTVIVRLEDLSGNVGFAEAGCTILGSVPRLTIEAGSEVPPLKDFLPNDTVSGRFVTEISTVDTSVPGVYDIKVEAEGEVYESALVIEDTIRPVCTFEKTAFTRTGQALAPESLVTGAEDASALRYGFEPEPDWNSQGYQDVTVTVTDAGGNRIKGTVTVLVSDLQPLVWEASRRSVTGPQVLARQKELDPGFSGLVKVERFTPRTLGCFDVNATIDDVPCIQRLYVVDTVAPHLAFKKKLRAYLDHPLSPSALLNTAADETPLTFFYTEEPDWSKEGEQPVAVAAVDVAGNRTEIKGTVTVVQDTEKPKIVGVTNQYVYIGDPIAYFASASATDNADEPEDITLTVDNSAVNIYKRGSYPVIYRATDRAGNTAEKKVYLYFIRPTVDQAKLEAKADEILSKLVTDDMTKGEKAYAIFRYVKGKFRNTERSNKRDWKYEAWRGLNYRRGDCFTFNATCRILLERIGAKVMFITRNSGAHHYWLLVDLGTGWYHFDTYNDGPSRKYDCFMLTTQEVLDLYPFFWKYDHKVYPETATEPFVWDW